MNKLSIYKNMLAVSTSHPPTTWPSFFEIGEMYNQSGLNHRMLWSLINDKLGNALILFSFWHIHKVQTNISCWKNEFFQKEWEYEWSWRFTFDNGYGRSQFDENYMKMYKYFIYQIYNTHHIILWLFTPASYVCSWSVEV